MSTFFTRAFAVLATTLFIGGAAGAQTAQAAEVPVTRTIVTDQTAVLTSTTWYEHMNTLVAEPRGGRHITIDAAGNLTGWTGCNNLWGKADLNVVRIGVAEVGVGRRHCENWYGENEGEFVAKLSKAQSYVIVGKELRITLTDGQVITFYNRG